MRLDPSHDEVVAMEIVESDAMLLTISETGLGKRTEFAEYPRHSRGGQGVLTHNVTDRTGRVVAARAVHENDELMLVSQSGIVIRTTIASIRVAGRLTQGVHVMSIGPGDRVASVAVIDLSKEPAPPPSGNGASAPPGNGRRPRSGNGRRSR
jgi:DNA gyrase subunit A